MHQCYDHNHDGHCDDCGASADWCSACAGIEGHEDWCPTLVLPRHPHPHELEAMGLGVTVRANATRAACLRRDGLKWQALLVEGGAVIQTAPLGQVARELARKLARELLN